jgi:hypothetical protein
MDLNILYFDELPDELIGMILLYTKCMTNVSIILKRIDIIINNTYFWKYKIEMEFPLIDFKNELINLLKGEIKNYQLIRSCYYNYINLFNKSVKRINLKLKVINSAYLTYLNISKYDMTIIKDIFTNGSDEITLSLYDCSNYKINEYINVNVIIKWNINEQPNIRIKITKMTKIDLINFLISCFIKNRLKF